MIIHFWSKFMAINNWIYFHKYIPRAKKLKKVANDRNNAA